MTTANARTMKFGGYHRRRSVREDAELTHVGPGTPGGEYLRRFWHPIALSSELGELPLAIRILDEELVLFRDLGGQVGLLHLRCSHRNTSLEYGFIQQRGIRCCYHGWHYDVGRDDPGHAGRAAPQPDQGQALPRRLSDPRIWRSRVRLYGPAGGDAGISGLRQLGPS